MLISPGNGKNATGLFAFAHEIFVAGIVLKGLQSLGLSASPALQTRLCTPVTYLIQQNSKTAQRINGTFCIMKRTAKPCILHLAGREVLRHCQVASERDESAVQ